MYQIQAVETWEELRGLRPAEDTQAAPPRAREWLIPEHIGLVAKGPDGPVGTILLVPYRRVGNRVTRYRLIWLYVLPEHRGRGVGRRLIEAAGAECARRGASTVQVPIHPRNESSISWWCNCLPRVEGLGFVVSLDRCGF